MQEILLVDDDQYFLQLVRNLLVQKGMAVQCSSSGEEALKDLSEKSFVLMITDLNMSGMDGLSLARQATVIAPDMPVIMITGSISPEIPLLAKGSGIVKVLAKPFNAEELLEMIRGVMSEVI